MSKHINKLVRGGSPGRSIASHLIALEPRMMFDGAAVESIVATLDVQMVPHDAEPNYLGALALGRLPVESRFARSTADTGLQDFSENAEFLPFSNTTDFSGLSAAADGSESQFETVEAIEPDQQTYIFIDTNVTGHDILAREWAGRGTIVLIDGQSDGVEQIRATLAGKSNIAAIHIVSHGVEGAFFLGATRIDQAAVSGSLASAFADIGKSLSATGDILIYGCDVGAGLAGQGLLDALAAATDADVAASLDDTGTVLRGGNWMLENRLGVIEGAVLVAERWEGLLAPAVLSVSSATTVLRVFNSAGTLVSDSTGAGTGFTGGRSVGVTAGGFAIWSNAGTVGGQAVDLRAVLVSSTSGTSAADVINFDRPTTTSNDPAFLLTAAAGTGTASIQVRWELVLAGTTTPVAADITYTIADLDGTGANVNAPTRESVNVSTDTLSSFQSASTSNIRFITNVAGQVTAYGTVSEVAAPPLPISAARFNWLNTANWTITYNTVRSASLTAGFSHDGNGQFNLGTGGVTTSIPRIDLDSNDSTAPGSGYLGSYIENGTAAKIVDSDVTLVNPVGTITSTRVTLTNAQTGDQLLVNGATTASGTLAGGISYTISGNVVQLTGAATSLSYQNALQAIAFQNTGERPATVDRNLTIGFSNGTFSSNNAVSTIRVTDINDTPTVTAPASLTGTEDTSLTVSGITLGDADSSSESVQLTVSVPAGVGVLNFATTAFISVVNNGTGTITLQGQRTAIQNAVNSGALTLAPALNYNGTSAVTFVFNDRGNTGRDPGLTGDATSEEARATAVLTIAAVNDAPVPAGNLPPQANVDSASGISVATASGFTDVDNATLSYSSTGLPNGLFIDMNTGVITGTIDRSASQAGAGGVYSVVVTARDAAGLTATQTFSWTVTNPVPVAVDDALLTVDEDTAGTTVNVLANDSDADGDPLTITSASATNGTVVVNGNGTLSFTPNANYNGAATITYTISDGQGGTATATVPVTVIAVNDAPVRVGSLPPQTNLDAATGISVATSAGFSDVDNAALTYSAAGLPDGLSINSATGLITGTINRSASQTSGGIYNVLVTASDGSLSTTQAFTWTITNPAPIAINNTAATSEDTPIPSINVLGNDSDPDGDPLTVTSASAVSGTVTINPDGTLRYVPNANFNGTDTITYSISDGEGGTSTAIVTVTVGAENDAPTPVGSLLPRINVDAASGVNVPTSAAFADVDNATLTYSASGLPGGLSIDSTTGIITGTIDRSASQAGAGGVYSVVVTARDAGGLTATQTFSWTVTNPGPVASDDSATTAEDTPVTVAVLTNDNDPDGDPLTVISAIASIGTATIVGNQVQYTPPANYNGTATITYTISDGQGGSASATLTVNVTPANDAPVATPIPPRNTTDGASISVPVALNFTDLDGDTLSFAATGLPAGLSIDPVTGVISGMIDKSASQANGGVYTATITASDGKGGTVTQTITFNVSNPPPVAANDSATTSEDTPVTISPLANDSDPDGDPLTITSAAALNGTVVINPDGTITYTPNPGFNGSDTITYEISDGNGGISIATITVSVADVNDVPVTSGTIANQTNLDSQAIILPVSGAFVDPDGDALSFTAIGLPAGLTINASTGIISGTIDNSASQLNSGVYSITVTANDGRGGSVSQTFSWTVTNPAPGAVNDAATTNEDTAVQIVVLANDVDPDSDPLLVTAATAGNGTVTINPDGSLVYTPNPDFNGADTIFYTITDSEGGISTATVNVTVVPINDAPTTVGLPNQNGDDGQTVSFSVASAFGDPDGDPLTFTATNLPPNLTIDPVTGQITGTLAPETSQNGPYVVTVTATDPSGAQITTSFVYSVQNVPPVAVNDMASTPEDVPVRVTVLTNDSDPDGDPLTITSASASNGTVVINPDGTLTFTPNPNFNGIATVSYTVSDGNGGIATATLTIDVGAVNDAPTTLAIPNQVSVDGAFYSANAAPFFSDIDGDVLTFSATGLPLGLSIDPATGIVSGNIDRNASQVNGGIYSITVTADDGKGGTVSQTFTGTVTNPAPTAVNDTATTNEDTSVAIPVLANDTDPDSDPLTVTSATALNGTVSIGAGGVLTYTPNAHFNGEDTITYVISDGNGGQSTATVRVTVTPVNDVPVAVDDSGTTNEDTPVTLNPLANDSDVDGDPLTITAASSPDGTVVVNPDGTITFTPAANFNGPATITYTISDGNGGTSTATINVTVDMVNDAPVANPSVATTNEDTPILNIPVLANDIDVDGDPLTVTAASAPNGTVTINPDGTVNYTPNPNFNGSDTITYTISDGKGGFSTSTVAVAVTAVNDAPTATPIAPQNDNDADAVSYPVAGNFSDVDGDPLTFTATGLPAGLSIDPATGVISGMIDPAASQGGPATDGVYSVTVTASDGKGGTVSETFSWTVANPTPSAANDTAITNEDTPVIVTVLSNDSDPDGDPLTVNSATAPNGTVVINPDGTVSYTPNANFNGTDTITYTISDGNGGTSTAIVTVTINPANDAPMVDTPIAAQTDVDNAPVSIPVAGNFSDLDGDTLSFVATGLPTGLTIDPATGVISGTIDRNASQAGPNADGLYTVSVTASDGNGGTVTTTFTYTVTNPRPTAANDAATTPEDTPVIISPLANDNDPDGDPLTITSATSPDGTVVINPDGTITFTPTPNFNRPTTITYAISDGNGDTATATVNVNVTPVNDAPIADTPLANASGVDGTPGTIPTAGAFSDLDGDTLSYSATGLPLGLNIDPATGLISGTVDRSASQVNGGVYTIAVTASDGNGGTVTSTFTYTVTNPGPTAVNDAAATNEDTPVIISPLANDSDPDADPLTITAATAPNGSVTINGDGTVTYTPTANFNGTDTITYTISDGNGGTATATIDVTIAPVNDAPTADPPLSPQANMDADTVSVDVSPSFADLDGDTLSFTATGLPAGLSISTAGVITGTIDPAASQVNGGSYTVTVTASDGNGGTVTSSFAWSVGNPAPNAVNDVRTTSEDTPINIAVLSNDTDPDGDALTVTAASAPNGLVVINANGTIDYTPNVNFNGTDVITYTISDGNGGTSTATVTVTVTPVNDAPTSVALPNLFDIDNSAVSIPLALAFTDLDGDTLSFSASGLPAGVVIDSVTGALSGQIANNASTVNGGVYSVTIMASDGNGGTVSTLFTWTIDNDAPSALDDVGSTNEDTPVTLNVLSNDTDPDLDQLRPVSLSATNGTAIFNNDGTITFTPDPGFNGTATVTYLITDDNGGFSTATAVITVGPINDAPIVTPLPDRADQDGDVISIPAGAQFSDPDGDALQFSAIGLPAGLFINETTGEITGTIAANASTVGGGVYSVTVTADDGNGGVTSISFTYSVSNPGPTAVDDTISTTEETPVIVPVSDNDTDPDSDTLTITTATAPNGTIVINADGTIAYTPDANFNGTDIITYTISDGQGGVSTAIVTVTVTAANDAPTATPLPARANVDNTPVTLSVADNFSDLDGDTLTFTTTGLPTGLSLDAAGNITGTITPGASQDAPNGIFSVTVTANDGQGGSVVQTFSWTVTNPPPVAVNDTASTNEDTAVDIPVLANDSDPDGDPRTVTVASAGNGTVTIGAGGVLTYTPNADFNGTDTITYTISDGNGGTSTATVTVTVGAVNDAPVSTPIAPRNNVDSATVSVPVAANFSDVDNATLAFSATGLPTGLSIDQATGIISGTIDRGASQANGGVYSVTVTARDVASLTTSQTFNWTVTNPLPVAVGDTATTAEDTLVNVAVRANDSDPDGDPLAITLASAANGTVVIRPDGTLDYTPNTNFNGSDTITYTISDGNGGTATATVTVTVTPVNDAPVATDDASSTDEDTPVVIAVQPNDTDLDGDLLTVTAAAAANGIVVINPDGTVTYTPNADFNGTDSITYTISDGKGGTDTATVTVIVRPVNDVPVAINDTATTPEDTPVIINVLGNDSDVDGDPLSVVAATSPDGQVTINPDGSITFAPDQNFNGTTTVTYTISDGNGGFATTTVTLTVGPVNDPPAAVNDNAQTLEDAPITVAVLRNDSDVDGDPLTVTAATAGNGTVVINPDGTITYTPNPDFNGVDLVTYTISDGKGGFSTATLTIGVGLDNDAPVATPIAAQANRDGDVISLPLAANFSDVDADPLTFSATGLPAGLSIDPGTGVVSGTIDRTASQPNGGVYTVAVTVADGQGGVTTQTFSWTVTNPAPVAANDTASTREDTPVTLAPLVNDTDPDGDLLAISTASAPNGTVAINPDGTITYTPDANFNGTDTVTYTINDGNGGTSTATITVTVAPVNDAPAATNDNASTAEDTPVTVAVLPNDSDVDGDPLTVVGAIAANGTVVINPDGTITYTPNADFNGVDTVTYTISDGNGGTSTATVTIGVGLVNDAPTSTPIAPQVNPDSAVVSLPLAANFADRDGDPLNFSAVDLPAGLSINPSTGLISGTIDPSASQPNGGVYSVTVTAADGNGGATSQTFTWTVTNPAPNATNDTASTTEDAPVTVAVLANDNDPDGDPLTITAATSPNGTVIINPDGTLTFTPTANFNGPATISYTISDGNGGIATATATVVVTPVNDPPVATNDNATTNEDTPVTLAITPNDSDLDSDPLTVVAASAANGVVVVNPDGTITYTPNANFNGLDSVTYTISDGKGGTSTATVLITVNRVNDVPVAVNDTATTAEDQPVTIPLLANDSDADGNPLSVTAATSPNGTIVINPDGTITFSPNANFNGPATITYTISDGMGGTAMATVTVNVTPVNDPPLAVNDSATVAEDMPLRLSPLANDSDVDGNPLTIVAASSPNGLVTINPDGTISFVPNANFNGPTTISYQISDGQGGFATATITVNVTPVNDPPIAANDAFTVPEDTTARIPVLVNDTDLDGDPLTVTAASSPNGSVAINADGTISFTPNPNFNGEATITYTISDGKGGTSTATVTGIVAPVNDPVVLTAPIPNQTANDSAAASLSVARFFADVDADMLTFSAGGLPSGLSIDPVTGVISGTIDRAASQINGGVYTVVIVADDGKGGAVRTTFIYTVANPAPIARNDMATTAEDTPVTIPVLANDFDPDGDPLTITAASSPNGAVVINADGTISFTPAANFNGPATITYTISDGNGGTTTATVIVNVAPVNDPPVDADESVSTLDGGTVNVPVLANSSDLDGDSLYVSQASVDVGSVIINPDGTLSYTAPIGFEGVATVSYIVSDGNGGFNSSTVTVNVTAIRPDMNVLLKPIDQGQDNGWHVDAVRDQSEELIEVPLIIDQTANEFRSLRPTPMLFGDRPLLTAINAMSSLRGITDLSDTNGPIGAVVDDLNRIRDIRFGADRLFDPRFGDFIVKSLTGFSVRQLNTGVDQIMVESVVRDRVVYMEVRDIGAENEPRIVEYQLRTRSGAPLPEWVTMDSRGLAIVERPVDAETIRLIVRAIRADGKVYEIPVLIQGATGEIQIDEKLMGKKISAAEPLAQSMAMASNKSADEAARLAAAFGSEA